MLTLWVCDAARGRQDMVGDNALHVDDRPRLHAKRKFVVSFFKFFFRVTAAYLQRVFKFLRDVHNFFVSHVTTA